MRPVRHAPIKSLPTHSGARQRPSLTGRLFAKKAHIWPYDFRVRPAGRAITTLQSRSTKFPQPVEIRVLARARSGCWDRLIGSIVLQVRFGRRPRYDGYEGAQFSLTSR
jgi:hypothetical protein